ncbi:MAG: MarR family transcriptional regulator [Chitinophagales bacterium]|nr:MarR family transcriptional regulator [Chitinophagales bacterium]
MELQSKIVAGLERISEVFKSLLWEKAKVYGISPIQIQILLFVSNHSSNLCNVSYLAKEFNLTKPTISDAVRVLLKKGLLEKDFSPSDNRRYNVQLSSGGVQLVGELSDYASPVLQILEHIDEEEMKQIYGTLSRLIYQLNQKGIIQVQRSCFGCRYYKGDKKGTHFCSLLDKKLAGPEIRLDCPEFESKHVES